MNKTLCAALALAVVLSIPQANARSDRSFVRVVTEANLAEVDASRLAERRARDGDVRELGQMLVRDHRSVLRKLSGLARRQGIYVPARPNAEQRAAYRRLAALHGRSFDLAYLRLMVKNHEASVSLFRSQTRERRAFTRRFARETLPTLQQHLAQARSLLDAERGGRTGVRHLDRDDIEPRNDADDDRNNRHRDHDNDNDATDDNDDRSDNRGGTGRY